MTNTFIAQALPWIVICYDYKIINNYLFQIAFATSVVTSLITLLMYKNQGNKIQGNWFCHAGQ